jgi:iron complex transport system substrate-binding protein
MRFRFGRRWLTVGLLLAALLALVGGACGADEDNGALATPTSATTAAGTAGPESSPTPTADPQAAIRERLKGVPGIVDPSNLGWPRRVTGLNGERTIQQKPQRIHTMSAGIDEITLSLVPIERVVGVGSATKNPDISFLAPHVQGLPTVAREPEAVIRLNPELVIATPTQRAELVAAIENAGIPVIQLDLDPTPTGRINAILLLGYIYGEEERAVALADEVASRYDALVAVTGKKPDSSKPVVVSLTKYTSLYAAGSGTTGDGIILAAGGRNGAAEAGIEGNKQISLETVVAANPDVIIIPMPSTQGEAFKAELLKEPVLASVPAIRTGRVYVVPPALYTTNSFANVRAAEHLAHILWPAEFPVADPPQFRLAGPR